MHPLLEKIKPSSTRGDIFLSLFIITTLSWLVIGDAYNTSGNGGDILIPYLSAQALKQGLELHTQFHSILGWLYHYLNFGLLSLIDKSDGFLKQSYLIGMSSAVFGSLLCSVYVCANFFSPSKKRIHPLFLLTALSICFTPRWFAIWAYDIVSPNGMYSKHCAALLFIHAGICLQWYTALSSNQSPPTIPKKTFYVMCLLQAAILYISFNYKITGFIAESFLTGGLLFAFPNYRQKLSYAFIVFISCSVMTGLTALFGYSYVAYFKDLIFAAHAKTSASLPFDIFFASALVFTSIHLLASYNSSIKKISRFVFALAYALAFLVCIWSITSFPSVYGFAAASIVFYTLCKSRPLFPIKMGAIAFITLFIGFNILAAGYQKFNQSEKLYINTLAAQGMTGYEYLDFIKTFNLASRPSSFFINLSSKFVQDKNNAIVFTSSDDIKSWNDTSSILDNISIPPDTRIGVIGFANVFPFIQATLLPQETWHWKHLVVNVPADKTRHVSEHEAQTADIFYMPIFTPLGTQIQSKLNCGFYEYNYSSSPSAFKLLHASPSFLLWGKKEFIEKNKIKEITVSNKQTLTILKNCAQLTGNAFDYMGKEMTRMQYSKLVSMFDLHTAPPESFIQLAFSYSFSKNPWANFDTTAEETSSQEIKKEINQLSLSGSDIYINNFTAPTHQELKNKKVVIIPVLSQKGIAQTEQNCSLLNSPEMLSGLFLLAKVTPYNLYWYRNAENKTFQNITPQKIINNFCAGKKMDSLERQH